MRRGFSGGDFLGVLRSLRWKLLLHPHDVYDVMTPWTVYAYRALKRWI